MRESDMQLITPYGEAYPLKLGLNTVGRKEGSDIVLRDGSMSRHHAELHWDGHRCVVVDLDSTNGTFLNGQWLPPGQPQTVPPGAYLSFGPTMTVTLVSDQSDKAQVRPGSGEQRLSPGQEPFSLRATGLEMIFRALDVALDYRKLGLALLGFLIVGLVGGGFLWVSAQILFDSAVLGIGASLMGLISVWVIMAYALAVLCRLSLVELREGRRGDVGEALRYAGRHFVAFFFSPLILVLGLALVLVVESILLLVGRIDYLGELVVSLTFLPLVLLNLLILLIAWFGTSLTFPTVADRGEGVGRTLLAVLNLARRAPARLIAYMVSAGIISLIAFLVCLYFLSASLYTTLSFVAIGMEPAKFFLMLGGLPLDVLGLMPGWAYGVLGQYLVQQPVTLSVARLLFWLSFGAVTILTLSIPQLFYVTTTCAVYLGTSHEVSDLGQSDSYSRRSPHGGVYSRGGRVCQHCGAPLAYGQSYCPHCGHMQR